MSDERPVLWRYLKLAPLLVGIDTQFEVYICKDKIIVLIYYKSNPQEQTLSEFKSK